MPAQIDFAGGSEPAKIEVIPGSDYECGLGEVHFAGDRLHSFIVTWVIEQTHRGRVAGERPVGERINLQ